MKFLLLFFLSVCCFGASVKLAWKDNSTDEQGFIIERDDYNSGYFFEIARVSVDTTEFIDLTAPPFTEVSYRIRAYNVVGNSDPSNIETTITGSDNSPPVNVRIERR